MVCSYMEDAAGGTEFTLKGLDRSETLSSLNQEILQLEKTLKGLLRERCTLEKALCSCFPVIDFSYGSSMPKPTKELTMEIAVLELEVMHLEKYLLILYRKAFEQQLWTSSPVNEGGETVNQPPSANASLIENFMTTNSVNENGRPLYHWSPQKSTITALDESCTVVCHEKLNSTSIQRTHSLLSCHSVCSERMSPSSDPLCSSSQSCMSQPLSSLQDADNATSGVRRLAEYLGTIIADPVHKEPNKLSEEMVHCMAYIYCKLSYPPLNQNGLSSPASSSSSTCVLSPQYFGGMCSPECHRESSIDSRLINPFRVKGMKEFSGPYNFMVEVPSLCRDSQRMQDVEHLLQNFNFLLHQLETVDPKTLKNNEKLAFWVNVHNALMMHAHLCYNLPQHNKRGRSAFNKLVNKAKCVIGGQSINVEVILSSILGCNTHYSRQWIRTNIHHRMKRKSGDEWNAYAIQNPEPLLHFALCLGSHSDPAVRVYNPKKVFQQMESAKEEYIRATVAIWREQKIHVPKLIDSYSKDKGLSTQNVIDMIQCYLPEALSMAVQRCRQGRSQKIIEWVPPDLSFRYLLSRELASPYMN